MVISQQNINGKAHSMWVKWMGKTLRVPEIGERKQHHSRSTIYEVTGVTNLISTTVNSTEESRAKFPPTVSYRDIKAPNDPFCHFSRPLEFWDTNFKEPDGIIRA